MPAIHNGGTTFMRKVNPMRTIAVEQRQRGLVNDLLDALAATAQQIGWRVRRTSGYGHAGDAELRVVWNGRHVRSPAAPVMRAPAPRVAAPPRGRPAPPTVIRAAAAPASSPLAPSASEAEP
ncbi:MAG TPA: hypothetical protein VGX50_16265, partial [Longimicrobium sp.]|nr:hypothetical protein [Longimicrobium sp.]